MTTIQQPMSHLTGISIARIAFGGEWAIVDLEFLTPGGEVECIDFYSHLPERGNPITELVERWQDGHVLLSADIIR